MYKLILAFLLCCVPLQAAEQTFSIKQAEDTSVCVSGMSGGGSGIAIQIDGNPYILIADHIRVVAHISISKDDDLKTLKLDHLVVVNGESKTVGMVVAANEDLDVALLQIPKPVSKSFAQLATKRPNKGDVIHHVSTFEDPTGEDSYSRGYVSKPSRKFYDVDVVQIDCALMPGSSGGPIFGNDMKCYGMAVAVSDSGTIGYCISSIDIHNWIKSLTLEYMEMK